MTDQNVPAEDYISVSSFKNTVWALLKGIYGVVLFVLGALKRNIRIFLAIIIVGVFIGYSFYLISPRSYKYDMVAEYNVLTGKTYYEIFNQLNTLVRKGSGRELATELHIGEIEAANVIQFEAEGINGQALSGDTSSKTTGLFKASVSMRISINPVILQDAILDYINNRPYLKKIKDGQREIYNDKMAFIDQELRRQDSLKDSYNRFITNSRITSTVYNNAFNPADLYLRSNELFYQKVELIRWLSKEEKALSLVDGFKQISIPTSFSVAKHVVLAILFSILIGIVICLSIEVKRRLS